MTANAYLLSKSLSSSSISRGLSHGPILFSKLFGPEGDFEDEMESIGDPYTSSGGDDLARDFYNELQKRKKQTLNSSSEATIMSQDEIIARIQNAAAPTTTSKPQAVDSQRQGEETPTSSSNPLSAPLPKKKYTGQGSFYAQNPSPPGARGAQGRTPREMMMEREYQLVGRAEQGIAVQAVIAILALAFYFYVGLSGGIATGRDAQLGDFGADDEIPFEQLMPVQRDREVSVWL